nr:uncharacterized protein [uncultured bacterium]
MAVVSVAVVLVGGAAWAVVLGEGDSSSAGAAEPAPVQPQVQRVAPSGGVYVPDIGTLVPELRNLVPDAPLPREEPPGVSEPPPPRKASRPRYDNKTQAEINNAKARAYLVGKSDSSGAGKKGQVPCNTINIGTVGDGPNTQLSGAVTSGNISSISSGCK